MSQKTREEWPLFHLEQDVRDLEEQVSEGLDSSKISETLLKIADKIAMLSDAQEKP